MGATLDLVTAGARIHQAGCLGCIGIGQAPARGRTRCGTFPRNFPGRSGTAEDAVWLCSPDRTPRQPPSWPEPSRIPVVPLEFPDRDDFDRTDQGDVLMLDELHSVLQGEADEVRARNVTKGEEYRLWHRLSPRQARIVLAGGLIPELEK
ncbi:hypothetical protein [Streptomyces sp. NPDC001970]